MNEFNKIFDRLVYRHNFMTVFDDFLTVTLCAFGMGRYEDEYFKTMHSYTDDEKPLFAHMLGALVQYYDRHAFDGGWVDGLGEFFEMHNGKFGRDAMGQFFTPPAVCDLMAMITRPEGASICDPAAGSGRCLLASDRTDPNNRLKTFYTAMDIDARCVKMCTLNMVLYGMKGAVLHMDSLNQNIWGGYRVYLPETGLGVIKLTSDQARTFTQSPMIEKQQQPKPQQEPKPTQLKLFQILTQ